MVLDRGGPSATIAADRPGVSRQPQQPRTPPASDVCFHSAIGGVRAHESGTTATTPTPAKRVYAKPRPKVRGRDQTGSGAASGTHGTVVLALQGELPTGPRTDSNPPIDNLGPDQMRSLEIAQGDVIGDPVERGSRDTVPRVVDAVDGAMAAMATEAEAGLSAAAAESASEEDDDYELTRLRRRGDLPVKVNTSTGLPSGVASLRRDQATGSIRVLRPPGTTLAVDASTIIFLDELSGFERRPDVQQPYMQGWADPGFVVRSRSTSRLIHTPTLLPCPSRVAFPGSSSGPDPLAKLAIPSAPRCHITS